MMFYIQSMFRTKSTNHWVPSPVLVVGDHIYQCAQCSGELRWIWRQFLSWWASSLPFDLFASFLSSLQFFFPMMIAFTFLQTDVLFHLPQGPVLSCLRLQEEGAEGGDIWWTQTNLQRHSKVSVTVKTCTICCAHKACHVLLLLFCSYLSIARTITTGGKDNCGGFKLKTSSASYLNSSSVFHVRVGRLRNGSAQCVFSNIQKPKLLQTPSY